jgi:hypothetical protein
MKLPVASHTFLNDWDNCPYKAMRKFIVKDLPRSPQTDAMKWGNEVHSAFENYLREGIKFPKEMQRFEAIARPLAEWGAMPEKALGISENGNACGFWASDVWLRGKLDAPVVRNDLAVAFDFKTGKRREEKEELRTHAVLLKAHYPQVKIVIGHYVWLQDNEVGKPHDVSDTETKLAGIRSVMNTVQNCIEIEDFPKRPNPLCGWCDVMDCEFNRKGRK